MIFFGEIIERTFFESLPFAFHMGAISDGAVGYAVNDAIAEYESQYGTFVNRYDNEEEEEADYELMLPLLEKHIQLAGAVYKEDWLRKHCLKGEHVFYADPKKLCSGSYIITHYQGNGSSVIISNQFAVLEVSDEHLGVNCDNKRKFWYRGSEISRNILEFVNNPYDALTVSPSSLYELAHRVADAIAVAIGHPYCRSLLPYMSESEQAFEMELAKEAMRMGIPLKSQTKERKVYGYDLKTCRPVLHEQQPVELLFPLTDSKLIRKEDEYFVLIKRQELAELYQHIPEKLGIELVYTWEENTDRKDEYFINLRQFGDKQYLLVYCF